MGSTVPSTQSGDTPVMHNASIDQDAASDGACAQVHLPTGRMCTLRKGHAESCDFISAHDADESLAQRKADEGW
jgi:hypothetical protein